MCIRDRVTEEFPACGHVMLGRGFVANPALLEGIAGEPRSRERLMEFHGRLLEDYGREMSGERNLLFKMKAVSYTHLDVYKRQSLVYNWESEIERFVPGLKFCVVDGTASERREMLERAGEYDLLAVSYTHLDVYKRQVFI